MTTLVLSQCPALSEGEQWNWPRVGALSGALSLHVVAIVLLLAPPVVMTLLPPVRQQITEARLLDEPPPKSEEPPLPKPPPLVQHIRQKPLPQPPMTAVPPPVAESPLHSVVADPAPNPDPTPSAPAEVAPVALAYQTRTRIPYPHDAFLLRQQGTVILRVLVGTDGVPQAIEIEQSSGSRSLDTAARDAVKKWTFQAGTRGGIATPLWARVPITFTLQTL
jgi:protein TonB